MKTTDSQHDHPVAPDLLKRDVTADAPNTKWVADIPGIGTAEGWFYLAAMVDIYSRMPRWMGHEQGARRTIDNTSGNNGDHTTKARSWSSASRRLEGVNTRARAISQCSKKLKDK